MSCEPGAAAVNCRTVLATSLVNPGTLNPKPFNRDPTTQTADPKARPLALNAFPYA